MSTLEPGRLLDEMSALATRRGAVAFGIADMSTVNASDFLLPAETLASLNRAISLAMPLSPAVLSTLASQPNLLYEHHYRQVNFALDRLALELAGRLQSAGFAALPIPASQPVDWENQRGHLSHKRVAVAAGLGWIGRSNLLVLPSHGARVRLVTVLTDTPFTPSSPSAGSCGPCRACINACPAAAIGESQTDFKHLACYEKLKEFQRRRLVSQYICGVCVSVCFSTSAHVDTESPDRRSGQS